MTTTPKRSSRFAVAIQAKSASRFAVASWLAIAVLAAFFPLRLSGQVTTAPTIVVKQPKTKYDRFRGEVVNCTRKAITVRQPGNVYNTRTFDFSPSLERKMENRSMDNGSTVTVKFQAKSNVAVSLKGKIVKLPQ